MANVIRATSAGEIGAWDMFTYRVSKWVRSPTPYLMLVGFMLFFGAWFLLSEVFRFWRFASLPGPRQVLIEWFNPNPVYGMSLYTPDYYVHVWSSLRRVLYAFVISTGLGVPFGLFLGWSKTFREFTFPVFETLRPIPVLAWVPLAIVMFRGEETPVIFLTTLASFYATALNTMLGVQSIDEAYPRAAACLGASKWQIFRHINIPGALPQWRNPEHPEAIVCQECLYQSARTFSRNEEVEWKFQPGDYPPAVKVKDVLPPPPTA
jgi:ABC-type nitrate/sulfonate/bicarbonate transport system permease component